MTEGQYATDAHTRTHMHTHAHTGAQQFGVSGRAYLSIVNDSSPAAEVHCVYPMDFNSISYNLTNESHSSTMEKVRPM